MALHIIPINADNNAEFEALCRPYIDNEGCITLTNPQNSDAVDKFIDANKTREFASSKKIKSAHGDAYLLSSDKLKPPTLPASVTKPIHGSKNQSAIRQYENFVAHAHRLIIATIHNGALHVAMDPRHDTAIFYRAADTDPWSIMRTKVIPKIEYIEDLLKHPPIKGLDTQLAIHTFENDTGEQTQILTRFYKGRNSIRIAGIPMPTRPFVQATAMYIRHPDGSIQTQFTPEDFFLDRFKTINNYLAEQVHTFGKLVSTKKLTHADLNDCAPFVQGKTHFVIFKAKKDRNNKSISGSYLQIDADNGRYVVQDENDTCLGFIIHQLQPSVSIHPAKVTAPSVEAWKKQNLAEVDKIEQVAENVRIQFKDKSFIIDTGSQLTLHGTVREDYLKAMILHAKDNWGGTFKIDNASDSERDILIKLAAQHDVRIIGLPRSHPTRPTTNRAVPTPAAAAHAA